MPSECSWMVCFCPTLLFVNYFFIVIIKNFNVVNWHIDNPWFLIEIVLSWFGKYFQIILTYFFWQVSSVIIYWQKQHQYRNRFYLPTKVIYTLWLVTFGSSFLITSVLVPSSDKKKSTEIHSINFYCSKWHLFLHVVLFRMILHEILCAIN